MLNDAWIARLKATKNESEWNAVCDEVKKEYGGYPGDWYTKVVLSGLMAAQSRSWG